MTLYVHVQTVSAKHLQGAPAPARHARAAAPARTHAKATPAHISTVQRYNVMIVHA